MVVPEMNLSIGTIPEGASMAGTIQEMAGEDADKVAPLRSSRKDLDSESVRLQKEPFNFHLSFYDSMVFSSDKISD